MPGQTRQGIIRVMGTQSTRFGRRTVRLFAPLARPVAAALWLFKDRFPPDIQSTLMHYRYGVYRLPGEPYGLRYVAPDAIDHMISGSQFGSHNPNHGIVDGEWDRRAYPFKSNEIYDLFVDHFVHGIDWEETEDFQAIAERIEDGESIGALDTEHQTVEQYRAYLAYWDDVYESIANEGYKSRTELSRGDDFVGRYPSITGDISVFVGRNGELICRHGKHRLTIAKLQDLDRVPVRMWVRHEQWQEIRDAVAAADSVSELDDRTVEFLGHPDLEDVSPAETHDMTPSGEAAGGSCSVT